MNCEPLLHHEEGVSLSRPKEGNQLLFQDTTEVVGQGPNCVQLLTASFGSSTHTHQFAPPFLCLFRSPFVFSVYFLCQYFYLFSRTNIYIKKWVTKSANIINTHNINLASFSVLSSRFPLKHNTFTYQRYCTITPKKQLLPKNFRLPCIQCRNNLKSKESSQCLCISRCGEHPSSNVVCVMDGDGYEWCYVVNLSPYISCDVTSVHFHDWLYLCCLRCLQCLCSPFNMSSCGGWVQSNIENITKSTKAFPGDKVNVCTTNFSYSSVVFQSFIFAGELTLTWEKGAGTSPQHRNARFDSILL